MMRSDWRLAAIAALVLAVGACAPAPLEPSVSARPGSNKPADAFAADQELCRRYAQRHSAPPPEQPGFAVIGSTLLGTSLGAGLGVAIGDDRGFGIADQTSPLAGMTSQQQYDIYYSQCMTARGNIVFGFSPGQYQLAPYPSR